MDGTGTAANISKNRYLNKADTHKKHTQNRRHHITLHSEKNDKYKTADITGNKTCLVSSTFITPNFVTNE